MKLSKLKIRNFRGYGASDPDGRWTSIPISDFTAFVGTNSSGKTAAFVALEKLFSPSPYRRNITKNDFHLARGEKIEDKDSRELSIEAVFTFGELAEQGRGELTVPPFFDALVVEEPGSLPYIRIRLDARWSRSSLVDGTVERSCYYVASPESTIVSEKDEIRVPFRRADIAKIQFLYVPALRDTEGQIRNSSGTLMHEMLQGITWSENVRKKVLNYFKRLDTAFTKVEGVRVINGALSTTWSRLSPGFKFGKAEIHFDSGNLEQAIRNSDVYFSPAEDGGICGIDFIGDGHKSLFYISMASALIDVHDKLRKAIQAEGEALSVETELPTLTIMAVEEPENHIAPHLLGKVTDVLKKVSKKSCAQSLIASHSSSVISRVEPVEVRHFMFNREDGCCHVHGITLPGDSVSPDTDRFVRCAVKAYPELYFAKLVVLCEGDSEQTVLPRLFEVMTGNTIDAASISVVPLGGRHVNHFWRLLTNLKIPFVTILDFDRERYGGAWGRIKYALEQLLKNGKSRNEVLLGPNNIVLDEAAFVELGRKKFTDSEDLEFWLDRLRAYHVHFSYPLDLDWLMLNAYGDEYKVLEENARGPNLSEDIQSVITSVLKRRGGHGETYSRKAQEEMRWYDYLFLGRGKPATHAVALSRINEDKFKKRCPKCLKMMIADAKQILGS